MFAMSSSFGVLCLQGRCRIQFPSNCVQVPTCCAYMVPQLLPSSYLLLTVIQNPISSLPFAVDNQIVDLLSKTPSPGSWSEWWYAHFVSILISKLPSSSNASIPFFSSYCIRYARPVEAMECLGGQGLRGPESKTRNITKRYV